MNLLENCTIRRIELYSIYAVLAYLLYRVL